jgi:hypothetical protein
MPRIALCLAGLTGTTDKNGGGETLDPEFAYNHYRKHLLDANDAVDIYMHSWSVDDRDVMNDLYKPRASLFEPQEHFGKSANVRKTEMFGVESRVNSILRCLRLAQDAESEHNFTYDYILISRFDVALLTDFCFADLPATRLVISHWNDRGRTNNITFGIYDFWFVGTSDLLHTFFTQCNRDYTLSHSAHIFWRIVLAQLRIMPSYHFYVGADFELVRRLYFDGQGRIDSPHYRWPPVHHNRMIYRRKYASTVTCTVPPTQATDTAGECSAQKSSSKKCS